ncbi:Kelch repeat-containing protein [Haloprofundus halophilus]|uniref:Kelch repeat-containing protein n=1 Tax=Haloprofundus halophilus TaxID=2283527 RepID=UPI0013003FD2|nr:kelch repeat-containing protein [Haloprofundus halophilus]
MSTNRRRFLRRGTVAAALALAGCTDRIGGAGGTPASTERPNETEQPVQTDTPTRATASAEETSWTELTPMPGPERTEVESVALDGELYVIGGYVPDGVTGDVAVYNPDDDAWRSAAALPQALHHVKAVAHRGRILVFGGYTEVEKSVATTYAYDPQSDSWEERARMPTGRGAPTAELVNGKAYVAGGYTKGGLGGGLRATLEIYDPRADKWSKGPDMPTARNHLTSGTVGGKLYVVGGREEFGEELSANEMYDPEANEWTELTPMPSERGGVNGGAMGGRVFVLGGEKPEGTQATIEAYDPESDSWEQYPDMPEGRHGLGVAAIDGQLYAVSGGPEPGKEYSSTLWRLAAE